jgi:gliding motility-associated-like protein
VKRLYILLVAALLIFLPEAKATHIVGGELNYVHLGGSQYAITLIVYRDCFGGQAAFDNPARIGIYNSSGQLVLNVAAALDSVRPLLSTINSSCVTAPSNVCTEVGYYTEIVSLPPIAGGYTLAYQRCCRNAVVQNIQNPGSVGATFVATIPGTATFPNNSNPIWNQLPPLYICAGLPFTFDQSATDLDGDQLVYSLCTPNAGGTVNNPAPNPPAAPPYPVVNWANPYSLNDMLGGASPFSIDPVTGQITAIPGSQGTYLVGMCVQEFRNGVYLGETTREFQISVVNCNAPVASPADMNAVSPSFPFTNCTEFVQFQATNSSGFSVFWDFGDPVNPNDQSFSPNPSWTYPGPGQYTLTLVVFNPTNPLDPLCTDTVTQVVTIQAPVVVNAGPDLGTCPNESQQIGTPALPGISYLWSPTTGLDNPAIAQPNATVAQNTTFTVTATDGVGCSNTDQMSISLFGNPNANAGADVTICPGGNTQLGASGGVSYLWSPAGSLSNANIQNPVAAPQTTTVYTVSVTDADGCVGTDNVTVTVSSPQIAASADVAFCIGGNAQLSASGASSYTWSPATGLSNANISNPVASPTSTTTYTVSGTDSNGCVGSDDVTVTVNQLPNISAGFGQGVCAGSDAQLNATGGVSYVWSPALGLSNPNISSPIVTFLTDTMTFTVLGTDQFGCQNSSSVTVWQLDPPNVTVGPDTVICLGQSVNLLATGGTSYQWSPASGLSATTIANPTATPLNSTTYTVTVGQPSGNLVSNGDFSQGNVGFTSDYAYATNLVPESLYGIVTNANSVHPAFQGIGHTGNAPQDSFMVVNGSSTAGLNVWCQTISITPNTEYYFGAWVSSVVASNPAILQFSINGQVLGTPFTAPFNLNSWIQFFQTWNSGSATTANICIVNQNTITGGNDFAVDDITFSTLCYTTSTVQVDVNPQPVADAGPDAAICVGQSYQMQGAGGQTYQWVPPIGLADAAAANTSASPNGTLTYTLVVQDNIGCSSTDQMTLTVNPLPQANAGPDRVVCVGQSAVLQGSGGTTYVWTPSTALDNPNTQLPITTPQQDITYTVTVTNANGCVASDQVSVTVQPLPVVSAGVDSMICLGGSLVLSATGAATYVWSPLTGLSDPQSATPTASPQEPTVYTVVGTDANGCVGSDAVSITFFTATAGPDGVICLNDSVMVSATGGSAFSWSPTAGVSNPASGSPYLSPEVSTTYTVTITSASGCNDEAQVRIDVLTLPVAAFTPAFQPSCDGIYAQFTNGSENADAYAWDLGDGTTSNLTNVTHNYTVGPGSVVTLTAFNNQGACSDVFTLDFTAQWFGNDSIDILYPTFFSPNNDGVNDCFRPGFDGRFSDCYNLRVFNRWGALIYESTGGQNHCWDGRTKSGQPVDDGTYYYISQLNGVDKAGYVTLIR